MNRLRPHSVGLAFGSFLGAWHALWAFLVWAGAAQWLLDFVFRLHMIAPPYHITEFSLLTATALVLFTGTIGYASGWFIGLLWNHFALRLGSDWKLREHSPRHAH